MLTTALLIACSGGEDSLEKKQDKLEKYRADLTALKGKIEKLEKDIAEGEGPKVESRKPVRVTLLEPTYYKHPVVLQGQVESDQNVVVSAETGGRVEQVLVQEGQTVTSGQLMIRTDSDILRNSLGELTTAYELASITYEKQERLWKQNIGSEIEYLSAKNNKERLERQIATTQSRIAQSEVRSPIAGKVEQVVVNAGEMLSPGAPVARVVNMSDIKIVAEASERYLGKFSKGDSVELDIAVLGRSIKGRIHSVGSVINPDNRSYRVVIQPLEMVELLKPNLLIKVTAYDLKKEGAIVVPSRVVHKDDNGSYVYIAVTDSNGTQAKRMPITLGFESVREALVTEGLTGGEMLITDGHANISSGELLQIID